MFPLPLIIMSRPSSGRRLALAGVGLLAVMALFYADLPVYARIAALLVLLAGTGWSLRAQKVQYLRGTAEGRLEIKEKEEWHSATLLPSSIVLPGFMLLRYRTEDSRRLRTLFLALDSLEREDYRRLAVWLRHGLNARRRRTIQALR